MNQWCVIKSKKVFKLAFRFHAFPNIPQIFKTHAHKFSFQHYCKTKMSQMIFSSNHEIEMPWNVVLNHEIIMPQNSKVVQKSCEIKLPGKIFALKCTISVFLGTTPTSQVTKGKELQTTVVKSKSKYHQRFSLLLHQMSLTNMTSSYKNQANNWNLRETPLQHQGKTHLFPPIGGIPPLLPQVWSVSSVFYFIIYISW